MKKLLILALISSFSGLVHALDIPTLACFGTEPFWGVSTDEKGLLSMSDPLTETERLFAKTSIKVAQGTPGDFAFQIVAEDSGQNVLKLNVVKADCNDGMSDTTYPFTALVDVDGRLLFGCCK